MYADCHFLAYLLDPLQLGDPKFSEYVNREPATKRAVENLLYTMLLDNKNPISVLVNAVAGDPVVVDEAVLSPLEEHMEFNNACRIMKEENSVYYRGMQRGTFSRLQFWEHKGDMWPNLAPLAKAFFHLSPSSATPERSFSAMGYVHTKLRNRLLPQTLEKLTYIKMNYPVAHPDILKRKRICSTVMSKIRWNMISSLLNLTMIYPFKKDKYI